MAVKHQITKLISFGFKHGQPPEAEIIHDVRSTLLNPWHVRGMHSLTGKDEAVQAYVRKSHDYDEFLRWVINHSKGVVAIGCTGGRHRSVVVVEDLGRRLKVPVEHRDLQKE